MPPPQTHDQFGYVFLKPDGNKGVSYKYTWGRGSWRLPPDVKPLRVLRGVAFWLSLAAFPVFAWPYLRPKSGEEEKKPQNVYAMIKVGSIGCHAWPPYWWSQLISGPFLLGAESRGAHAMDSIFRHATAIAARSQRAPMLEATIPPLSYFPGIQLPLIRNSERHLLYQ